MPWRQGLETFIAGQGSQGATVEACFDLSEDCNQLFKGELDVTNDTPQMKVRTLHCRLPKATEVRGVFRNEVPPNALSGAEFGNDLCRPLFIEEFHQLSQFSRCGHKVP